MPITFLLITSLSSHLVTRSGSVFPPRPFTLRAAMMNIPNLLFSFLLCVSSSPPCLSSPQRKPGCFKVNNCKCIMKDGSGVISLRAMGDSEGFLGRFLPLTVNRSGTEQEEEETLLSFSPCQPFSLPERVGTSECSEVAACVYVRSRDVGRFINFGRHNGNKFHYNDSLKVLSVSYFAKPEQPLTVVHYHCNPNQSASFIQSTGLSAEGPLHIWVESPCACPNACAFGDLGLGTIFLIMLCVSALAYFVLGSCALRPFRSSSGVQISPEPSVWCMICYHCSENAPRHTHSHSHSHSRPGQ
ncbi:hypothetical protein WMY93_004898 [Mugilogobius chulae]|uniref:Uncharacterized protein n=1 Tax=Mugilogobius chulae TaxID=88201 RepID=A0AAW0PQZ6_9GOBI